MKLFASLIRYAGILMLLIAVIGFIAGCFDYVLEISGSKLPLVDGPMAIILGVIGIVFFIGGHFMLKRAINNNPETSAPQLDINDLEFVTKALERTRRRNAIIGVSCLAFGALFFAVPFLDKESDIGTGGFVFILILGGLTLALGLFSLVKAVNLANIPESEVYKTIMLEPKTITALHAQIFRSAATKYGQSINATLLVGTKKLAILTVSETELELLRQYLLKHNPSLDYDVKEQVTR